VYTVLEVADMQRPIETNAFLVWGDVLKKVLWQRQRQ
jgi:hypothetical protein